MVLGVMATLCVAQPQSGQIVVDSSHPAWLKYEGGGPFYLCGPGDPEGFLYRGTRNADGTRDGDQLTLINQMVANYTMPDALLYISDKLSEEKLARIIDTIFAGLSAEDRGALGVNTLRLASQ